MNLAINNHFHSNESEPLTMDPIRILIVAPDEARSAIQELATQLVGAEIVGVAYNLRTAKQILDRTQPDLLLADVMLQGLRSIDVISYASAILPDLKILALSPSDPPHDRIILAIQAGALGYICRAAGGDEMQSAINEVLEGNYYLPTDTTIDVLKDAAPELAASAKERLSFMFQALLGFIPAAGLIAAVTGFLWREYWGQIGVRVVDIGVDASTRVTEFVLTFLVLLGILGPLHFVDNWREALKSWANRRPRLRKITKDFKPVKIGKTTIGEIAANEKVQWLAVAAIVLSVTIPLDFSGGRILTIIIGAVVALVMLANLFSLEDYLPDLLRPSKQQIGKALVIDGMLFLVLLLVLSAEVFLLGPDLREDGLHGFLAPKVLDLSARPVTLIDLNEKFEPMQALYLGGNADLYVLYDPCEKVVRMIPVGSSRVEHIPQVQC
ncbi:response regulator [Ruegeria arenilitoris]|uniref:response regulator n=1 Tax=Ruegeria arenilitoris TaxID=1173585 RepID=UPI00148169CF|nr:response regulator transcription factor [Ruegeria arenilitoris]